ncbi:MAG: hypothetical protein CME68_11885 [Halobacteriovoraceae bacterium]|nr:hypothetical protein [Halobacteriovoraceae bacterium]
MIVLFRFANKLLFVTFLGLTLHVYSANSKERVLGYSLFSNLETDFKDFDQTGKSLNIIAGFGITYKLNKRSSLSLRIPFLKSLTGAKDFNYLDGSLAHSYSFFSNKFGFSLNSYVGIGLPYSKNSRERNYLQTKITISPSLNYKLQKTPELTVFLSPALTKNFHRSNTNINGISNNSYILSLSGGGTYQFKDKGSLTLKSSILKLTTYGDFEKDRYNFEGNYSRLLSPKLKGSIGLSNGGEVTDYNGDLNVKIFDAQKATFSISIFYSF